MWYQTFSIFYEKAAERMCQECKEFIKKGSRILDLGCGSGIVGNTFQNFFKAEVMGVDITDRRVLPIPFKTIDGKSLPFQDNNFDAVLISYVLHHSQDPMLLLKEAKRVTRDKILVYEDLPDGIFSRLFCALHGFLFDKLFQNKNRTSFKTEEEWKKVFADLDLKMVFQKKVSFLNPVRKKLFVLQK